MWCIRVLYKNILTNRKFAVNELKNEKEIIINRIKASENKYYFSCLRNVSKYYKC